METIIALFVFWELLFETKERKRHCVGVSWSSQWKSSSSSPCHLTLGGEECLVAISGMKKQLPADTPLGTEKLLRAGTGARWTFHAVNRDSFLVCPVRTSSERQGKRVMTDPFTHPLPSHSVRVVNGILTIRSLATLNPRWNTPAESFSMRVN